jgi:type VI protein secretion system component Hcp
MVAKKNGNRKVKNLAARSISEKKAGNVKGGIVKLLDASTPKLHESACKGTHIP